MRVFGMSSSHLLWDCRSDQSSGSCTQNKDNECKSLTRAQAIKRPIVQNKSPGRGMCTQDTAANVCPCPAQHRAGVI